MGDGITISPDSLMHISKLFIGDEGGLFSYKSGPILVDFFNERYGTNDQYYSGFPSRWMYVCDKLTDLMNKGELNTFLTFITDKHFLMRDNQISEIEAVELSAKAI